MTNLDYVETQISNCGSATEAAETAFRLKAIVLHWEIAAAPDRATASLRGAYEQMLVAIGLNAGVSNDLQPLVDAAIDAFDPD